MKVLVADKFETVGVDGLKALGADVVLRPDGRAEDLAATVAEVNPTVLIVRGKKVGEAAIAASPALKLVIRGAPGSTPSTSLPRRSWVSLSPTPPGRTPSQ